jgi:hypothetical protein
MALPKKVKKYLPLTPEKQLLDRREQLLEYIQQDGTYLPKGVLHADMDRGVLDFVRDELECIVDYWPGSSSIFQIYNRALTAQEVLQNYNALKGRFGL